MGEVQALGDVALKYDEALPQTTNQPDDGLNAVPQSTEDVKTMESAAGSRDTLQSSSISQAGSESSEDLSKAIVYFRKEKGLCHPHKFTLSTKSEVMLGRGAFGDVFKVECSQCHKDFARKVIRFAPAILKPARAAREKHIRDTDSELRCYMTLDHPHIIEYVHHELSETKMQIYTEFCQLRDLQTFFADQPQALPDNTAWCFLEALASALARCHHGLGASQDNGVLSEYLEFEEGWKTILHRDIKPGNVLLAFRNDPHELVPKLGDFGTSFKLEDSGKPPSTQQVGTKVYWAPEIAAEAKKLEGRITQWSSKSDTWGVGTVIHCILTRKIPTQDQAKTLQERSSYFQSLLPSDRSPVSALLAQVVSECLDPSPDSRSSALQLLAVATKWDTSTRGLRRSSTFWKALSMHSDADLISSVTKHFVKNHLPLLASKRTKFSPREVTIITSLVKKCCAEHLSTCHGQLCSGFVGDLAGYTVFHALACVGIEDRETIRLAMDDSKWPESKELAHVALKKNELGLLSSALAALRRNIPLCAMLTKIEDQFRSEAAEQTLKTSVTTLRGQLETAARKEFEFMFKLLTRGNTNQFNIQTSHASTVMLETAKLGYANMVRKLIELGFPPSIRGKRHETALHIFAHTGNVPMISFLLENGAEVDARDKDSRTPLHWAAWAGKYEATRALMTRKAEVNAVDRQGRTALFGAAGGGYADVVRLLLTRHADQSLRGGQNNETPLERAMKRNCGAVIELLNGVKQS